MLVGTLGAETKGFMRRLQCLVASTEVGKHSCQVVQRRYRDSRIWQRTRLLDAAAQARLGSIEITG